MKIPLLPIRSALRLLVVATTVFLPITVLRAEINELRITVRPTVDYAGLKKPTDAELQQAKAHQRIYILAHLEGVKGLEKLVKPVNEAALAAELRKTLAANGYLEAAAHGPKPEIILSVYYGRGSPPNVYLERAPQKANGLDGPEVYSNDYDNISFDGPMTGHDEKVARASYEKLMILVVAMKYPSKPLQPGEVPQRLWKTLISVDDPDHRDLNGVMSEMLATAGSFFGQHIAKDEAEVWKPLPEGRIILGETKVIEDAKPAPKK